MYLKSVRGMVLCDKCCRLIIRVCTVYHDVKHFKKQIKSQFTMTYASNDGSDETAHSQSHKYLQCTHACGKGEDDD